MAPPHHQQPPDHGSMVSSTSLIMISKHSSSTTGDPSFAGYACPIIDNTHSDSDSSSFKVVDASASDNTKYRMRKTTRKPCKYKYSRTIVEVKKLIIQGKLHWFNQGKRFMRN
eukprot:scaffold36567_cov51-Attheya_sp.AAC.1